jgi:hypothetical protein
MEKTTTQGYYISRFAHLLAGSIQKLSFSKLCFSAHKLAQTLFFFLVCRVLYSVGQVVIEK